MNPYRQLGKQTWTKGAQGTYDYPDLTRIRAVHQGKTKGCGLAVVLYLQQFDGQDTPDVSDPKDFEALYTRMGLDPEGYNSFAQLLEDVETPRLRYMWFRRSALGRKTRSMPEFNADVGPPERILAFLRNLLDTGHVFAVPFNGSFLGFTLSALIYVTATTALGFLVGVALGNAIDRAIYGAVADFLDFHAGGYHWPAFNVADIAISVGVVMLLFDGLIEKRRNNRLGG